ncbi:BQ2448_1282 [Microbotryum intermedium]|uniref:Kinase n=1 Tax=Microbotryum intermedium TaxID=269621 RepID=A0A238FFH0_9BASI|nr:BQ2448_1282 [Microbotryum intermedium]
MPPFAQVGGHASTITSTGSIINKPSSAREKAFYTQLAPRLLPGFIGEWTPEFYGTLSLQGQMSHDGEISPVAEEELGTEPKEMLVLENVTYRFLRPNVLDIKLGTQLYDEDASEEKKRRMDKAARATTSAETGVRLTGFQVWDDASQAYVVTPKDFGKSITVPELPSGIARFFYPPLEASYTPPIPVVSTQTDATPKAAITPTPLPLELLVPVLNGMLTRLQELLQLLDKTEMRIRGGSLLFVIEGDAKALREATARSEESSPPRSSKQDEDQGDDRDNDQEDDDDESETESVSTTDGEGNAKAHTRLPWDLRLIDFAHARPAPGEGKDEGFLKGIDTTVRLIEELRDKLEKEVEKI